MSKLEIALDTWLAAGEVAQGVVARVRRLAAPDGSRVRGERPHTLVLPAGAGGARSLDVEGPGRYLVEATLPSGHVLSEEVDLTPDTPDARVELASAPVVGHSPHEWLSWQHLTGKIRPASAPRPAPPRSPEPMEDAGRTVIAGAGASGRPEPEESTTAVSAFRTRALTEPVLALRGGLPHGAEAWPILAEAMAPERDLASVLSASETLPELGAATGSVASDEDVALYRVDSGPGRRSYAVVETPDGAELATLPLPWQQIHTGQHCPLELLVRKHSLDAGFRTSVSVLDPDVGTALAYMENGDFHDARDIFEIAREMLYYKITNPLAAAAGGYMLLATAGREAKTDWHDWIHNLLDWFEPIPDGAVLYGTLLLRRGGDDEALVTAREAFVTAFERGLPYYSLGVTWLLEGLSIFGADDDNIAAKARAVRRVALAVNMDEAFTVVRFPARTLGAAA